MTDTTTTQAEQPAKPKMSLMKKIFIGIGIILAFLGIDHYTTNIVSGGATVTVNDSTIAISAMKDTVKATAVKVDTVKNDTTKKVVK